MTGPQPIRKTSRLGMSYTDQGEGPVVVLIHGWCLSGQMWIYLEEQLIVGHRVVNVDLAGFGESSGLAGPWTIERYAADVADLIDELGSGSVHVAAFAFGAAVALRLAASTPSVVASLILIGVPSSRYAAYDRMPAAMRRDWPLFGDRSARAICSVPLSEPSHRWLSDMFAATALPVAIATCQELERFDPLESSAGAVQQPVTLIHGAADEIVPVELARSLARRLPHAQLREVANCGHLVPLDQREALREIVVEAVAEARGPAR